MENEIIEIEKSYEYSTYLIGAMTNCNDNDGGVASRIQLEKELLLRNVLPINPATLEKQKTGVSAIEAIERLKGWVASGKRELIKKAGCRIWKGYDGVGEDGNIIHIGGDLDYVKVSDWLTFVLHKNDKPCGTYFECGVGIDYNIPIYLITNIPKKDLPQSLILGIEATDGEFFENLNQYFEFIDKRYNLKKENK